MKIYQELRYFLSNIAASGVLFSSSLLVLQPQVVTRGSMTIRVVHGPAQYLPENAVKVIGCLSVVSYLYAILSFPLFFAYRSMILSNSNMFGQYFTKNTLLITFGILFILSCVEGVFFYYSCIPYTDLLDRANRTTSIVEEFENSTILLNQHLRNLDLNSQHSVTASPNNISSGVIQTQEEMNMGKHHLSLFGDDYSRNPLIIIFYGILFACHVLSYLIILICAHFMLNTLKRKQGTMSQDTFLENELLVHSVFAESFVPLLLSAPVGANAVLVTVFENSLNWQEFLPAYCMSMVPVLSPLFTIMFIGPYKKVVVSILTLEFIRGSKITDSNNKRDEDS
uniref:G protein-coupled receptor n=1 Tax=Caenorhabditis tropicalis TaxID=1561998 RepID=A0A1I7UBS3_9PELO